MTRRRALILAAIAYCAGMARAILTVAIKTVKEEGARTLVLDGIVANQLDARAAENVDVRDALTLVAGHPRYVVTGDPRKGWTITGTMPEPEPAAFGPVANAEPIKGKIPQGGLTALAKILQDCAQAMDVFGVEGLMGIIDFITIERTAVDVDAWDAAVVEAHKRSPNLVWGATDRLTVAAHLADMIGFPPEDPADMLTHPAYLAFKQLRTT